jgi:hypothetical protein
MMLAAESWFRLKRSSRKRRPSPQESVSGERNISSPSLIGTGTSLNTSTPFMSWCLSSLLSPNVKTETFSPWETISLDISSAYTPRPPNILGGNSMLK